MAVEHTTPGLHSHPECTGAWRHLDVVETRYWRCKGCGALAYDCASVRRTILEHTGHRVLQCPDGRSALECVRAERPDLVLMGISMPGLDGWEVTRILKSDPRTSDIPILALTARAMPEDRVRGQKAGFEKYLMKPIEPRQVLEEVKRVLGDPQPSGSSPAEEPTGLEVEPGTARDEESPAINREPPLETAGEQSGTLLPPFSLGAHAAPASLSLA